MGRFAAWTAGALLLVLAMTLEAQVAVSSGPVAGGSVMGGTTTAQLGNGRGTPRANVADSSLSAYLMRVHAASAAVAPTMGSIWSEDGRLARLSTDVRAMRPHDLISVVVQESLAASTDGTVKNSRASNASSAVSSLFGKLSASNALQNLVNQNSAAGLNAQGQSQTNSSLATVLGGQVIEVLPNGMLVIDGGAAGGVFTADADDCAAGAGAAGGYFTAEPGAFDCDFKPGAGGEGQGDHQRLHAPAESAGALAAAGAGVLKAGSGSLSGECM